MPSVPLRLSDRDDKDAELEVLRALQHHEQDHLDDGEDGEGGEGGLGDLVFWFSVMQVALVVGNWGWKKWELKRRRVSGRKRGMSQGLRVMY